MPAKQPHREGCRPPSSDAPSAYAAVDLDTAFDEAVQKHRASSRSGDAKHALNEIAKQQRLRLSGYVRTFKILKKVKDDIAAIIPIIDSM